MKNTKEKSGKRIFQFSALYTIFKLQPELLGLGMSVCLYLCLQPKFDNDVKLGLVQQFIGEGERGGEDSDTLYTNIRAVHC